jgi:hypothetical protein
MIPRIPAIDLSVNPKQVEFTNALLLEIAVAKAEWARKAGRDVPVPVSPGTRTFNYGGAIRGGKTIACLSAAVILAKAFPGSRWHVVRAAFPDIRRTVLPSLDKVVYGAKLKWRRSADDYYCELRNGSRIYMFAENFSRDKDLNRWKGLETNGFIFEQLEEIQKPTYEKARERAGSWYDVTGPMPPPFILNTFNPTFNWVKEDIFDAYHAGTLPADEVFISALPSDNPMVTAEQWKQWKKMPPDVYKRFIAGQWEIEVKGAFLNMFDVDRHVTEGLTYKPEHELWVSFDFNVDPMTAIVFQTNGRSWFHVLKEYHIPGGDVYAMCDAIRTEWWGLRPAVRVTGDATGDARMSGTRGAVSQYRIIAEQLRLDVEEFELANRNPFIADSRIYCNSVLRWLGDGLDTETYGVKINGSECPNLVKDCRFFQVGKDVEGKVTKQVAGTNPYTNMEAKDMGHLLDCLRYGMHAAVPDFIEIHRS